MFSNPVIGVLVIMVFMTALSVAGAWAAHSDKFSKFRIRTPETEHVGMDSRTLTITLNGIFAIGLYVLFTHFGEQLMVHRGTTAPLTFCLQVLAIVLLYDFMYYVMHRLFHFRWFMKSVHGVHHKVRYPTAMDGLHLNPIDSLAATALLFLSIVVIGPVSLGVFYASLFAYLSINIVNHTGLAFPHPAFALTNFWARKHDIHHGVDTDSNFGSIVPFWDWIFGTYR